jgi:flagellar basal-body rod protein FlgC
MSLSKVFDIAGAGMTAQSMRLNVVSSNIANVDSAVSSNGEPYKGKKVVFTAIPINKETQVATVRVTAVVEDQSPARMVYDPKHPMADAKGYVTMPNINPVEEMTDMISSARSYQTNVEMMNTAKSLLQKTLSIGQQ